MGLLIKSTAEKKITISGTNFEVEQVYGRIAFSAKPNGREIEVATGIFASYEMFLENKPLFTDIEFTNFQAVIEPEEQQSIDTALKYARNGFIQQGYDCEVVNDTQPITDEETDPTEANVEKTASIKK
jgi:hypothetical protein